MPSAYSTLRIVRLALATAVAPIASPGSLLSHGFQSGAATSHRSSMQPLLSFTVVNTTQSNNNASLDNPGLLKFRGLTPSQELFLKSPIGVVGPYTVSMAFSFRDTHGNAVKSLSKNFRSSK
jgi:hypothetical protein